MKGTDIIETYFCIQSFNKISFNNISSIVLQVWSVKLVGVLNDFYTQWHRHFGFPPHLRFYLFIYFINMLHAYYALHSVQRLKISMMSFQINLTFSRLICHNCHVAYSMVRMHGGSILYTRATNQFYLYIAFHAFVHLYVSNSDIKI